MPTENRQGNKDGEVRMKRAYLPVCPCSIFADLQIKTYLCGKISPKDELAGKSN
jgi:hypothetical protein